MLQNSMPDDTAFRALAFEVLHEELAASGSVGLS